VPGERGERFLEYKGQLVRSKADFATLQQVAHASPQGIFVAVGTSNFDLGEIYRRVAQATRAAEEHEQRQVRQPSQYHPFAVAALLLVLWEALLREGARPAAATLLRQRVREVVA
jgi:hypothetical protein